MDRLHEAKYLALLILRWHQRFGMIRAFELGPQTSHLYLSKLTSLQALNLNEPESIREVANEQIRGVFEHFYSERIPEALQDELDLRNIPEDLGTVAGLILELLQILEHPRETTSLFTLPRGWEETPKILYPAAVQIPRKPRETSSQTLQRYFASLLPTNDFGMGGRDLMVAMNEDHGEQANTATNYITVYNPASFSFQLATGEDTLATLVLQGKIRLGEIVVGVSPNSKEGLQQEG